MQKSPTKKFKRLQFLLIILLKDQIKGWTLVNVMAYVKRFKCFLDQNGGLSSNAKRYRIDGYAQSGILMNYELSTADVGTYIYAGTIVFCIVISLSLPILVVCSKSFSRYKERVRERKILNKTDTGNSRDTDHIRRDCGAKNQRCLFKEK